MFSPLVPEHVSARWFKTGQSEFRVSRASGRAQPVRPSSHFNLLFQWGEWHAATTKLNAVCLYCIRPVTQNYCQGHQLSSKGKIRPIMTSACGFFFFPSPSYEWSVMLHVRSEGLDQYCLCHLFLKWPDVQWESVWLLFNFSLNYLFYIDLFMTMLFLSLVFPYQMLHAMEAWNSWSRHV